MNTLVAFYFMVKSWVNNDEGQDLIEYALIIALFVLVAVAGIAALNGPMAAIWQNIAGQLAVK